MRVTAGIAVTAGGMFSEVGTETRLPQRVERRFVIFVGVAVAVVSLPFLGGYDVVDWFVDLGGFWRRWMRFGGGIVSIDWCF